MNKKCIGYYDDVNGKKMRPGTSKTQQQFRDINNLNLIMANRHPKEFIRPEIAEGIIDYSLMPDSLQEAMTQMAELQDAFERVPSKIREEFGNDPVKMLKFLNNPENRGRAEAMGLIKPIVVPSEEGRADKNLVTISTTDTNGVSVPATTKAAVQQKGV